MAGSNLPAFKVKISRFQRFKMLKINANAGHTPDCDFLSSFFRHLLKLILVDGFGIGKFIQRKEEVTFLFCLILTITNFSSWYSHVRRRTFDAERTPSR